MRTVVGVLLADLVNAERLTKYAVVKGFHVMLNSHEVNERYPELSDLITEVRNTFEDRLSAVNPVNEIIFGANRTTSQWFECSSNKEMVNVEFLELLVKSGSEIHFKELSGFPRYSLALHSAITSLTYPKCTSDNTDIV
ncbi:Hypothetical protein CINCED_3A005507 [Cinara cedri]|uniref:Uncharacterized protein n=1 Tax=Cinara cedri TaxID=506608 RepID=A0A5E4NNU4_9HEMI|nr:Hypothetical protein CINCED_3A005507 [Cinara cedri]